MVAISHFKSILLINVVAWNMNNETPTVRGLAAEKNNILYTETMIFLWNNHYNLNFNV